MPSETIWSSTASGGSPVQGASGSNPGTSGLSVGSVQYRTVLDQVDPSVAKYFAESVTSGSHGALSGAPSSSSSSVAGVPMHAPGAVGRRFSFNDGGDIDAPFFLPRGSLLANLNGHSHAHAHGHSHSHNPHAAGGSQNGQPAQLRIFGAASISGGIASRHPPPSDSFLRKFASVADATRESTTTVGGAGGQSVSSVATSGVNVAPGAVSATGSVSATATANAAAAAVGGDYPPVFSSPNGSLNENLNIPPSRTSRHQSILEKIDNYNNTSPIQAHAVLSPTSHSGHSSSAQTSDSGTGPHGAGTFWNPATATSFIPGGGAPGAAIPTHYGYFMDPSAVFPAFQMYGRPGAPPPATTAGGAGPGMPHPHGLPGVPGSPNGVPSTFMIPSPPPFMDPGFYQRLEKELAETEDLEGLDENKKSPTNAQQQLKLKGYPYAPHQPGIGYARGFPSPGFMFPFYEAGTPPTQTAQLATAAPGPAAAASASAGASAGAGRANGGSGSNSGSASASPSVGESTGLGGSGPGATSAAAAASAASAASAAAKRKSKPKPSHIYRSPLLEEVRSNFKGKEYFLKDIYGHAIEFTKDQHGSRFIQQQLPTASAEEKEVIFNEIRDISYDLMTDVFGNYVIQKYFEFGSTTQKKILLEYMIGHIYELSLQMYGCRVVQRALEAIELKDQVRVITELQDYVLICAKDQNGNHVIQKSIERIPFSHITFILEALDNQIYHLLTHPYGCRVIQRLLEHLDEQDQTKILNELNRFIFYLIQDQYGNYVMQHILERGNPRDREEILKVVLGLVVNFSKHKFASNVIEKCIKFGTLLQRKRILHEVMLGNEDTSVDVVGDLLPLALMMKDQYANYVIQKLVEGFDARSDEKKLLVAKLRQYLKQISLKNNYGKHLALVEKMIIVAETALGEAEKSS